MAADPFDSQPSPSAAIESSIAAVKGQLKRSIAGSGWSQREVERQLGWGEGYVSQILRGKVGFKFKHCFAILAVIGVEPARFFRQLAEADLTQPPVARVQGGEGSEVLRRQVERIVAELLSPRVDTPAS